MCVLVCVCESKRSILPSWKKIFEHHKLKLDSSVKLFQERSQVAVYIKIDASTVD